MTPYIRSLEQYKQWYSQSVEDPAAFWHDMAHSFHWYKEWSSVFESDMKSGRNSWYVGAKLNITYNCLDRHVAENPSGQALIWEPNHPEDKVRSYTYFELLREVNRCANALKQLGVQKGDRICLYMPMIPEIMISVLACARIGAVHSVVFAGFSAQSLIDRITDAQATIVMTADGNMRGSKKVSIKSVVDEALSMASHQVRHVVTVRHSNEMVAWDDTRDVWWHELVHTSLPNFTAEIMDSEDPLFILYTSGSTGKPKGVVHTCGGYMVYAGYSFQNVFQYQQGELFWCTADAGWITGHTYLMYGPLLAGARVLMYEGVPTFPAPDRFWKICDKHSVAIFYTAPTAIRALMAAGDAYAEGHDLSTLRVLGTVGEPINEEAWRWYRDRIGRGILPVTDTWWQTETGGIMISSIPDVTDMKPCYAAYPLPGVQPVLVDASGHIIVENEKEGLLCIRHPWPSIIRTTYGDHDRCVQTYFSVFPGMYFTGDSARRDRNGRYRIIGRVDDVINVSGHRIGTAEVEDAINLHPAIVESAVVGFPHDIKGQGLFAFVILHDTVMEAIDIKSGINDIIVRQIGPIAKADRIMLVSGLPKTRSGKIMRRILRKVAENQTSQLGDITTLLNPEVVDEIVTKYIHQQYT